MREDGPDDDGGGERLAQILLPEKLQVPDVLRSNGCEEREKEVCGDQMFSTMGMRRMRLPVAAKMALQTAGRTPGTEASPMPPGFWSDSTI